MRTHNDTMKSLPLERRRKIETRATELETTLRLGEIPDEKNIVFSPAGENWASFKERLFTTEERRELDLRVEIISEMIRAREDRGMSRRELEIVSGVAQPVISRVERRTTEQNDNFADIRKVARSIVRDQNLVRHRHSSRPFLRDEKTSSAGRTFPSSI